MAIPNIAPYVVAKHGVLGLSDVLAAELRALGAPISTLDPSVEHRLQAILHSQL